MEHVLSNEKRWTVEHGDALDVLRGLPDNCVDSIVTDPPAGISFMASDWDGDKGGRDSWIAWLQEISTECMRVLKPGGHALVWSFPRTSHWTATALENAGLEIRDSIHHVFGSGFPHALDVSKAIDKAAGAKREVIGKYRVGGNALTPLSEKGGTYGVGVANSPSGDLEITAPTTDEAKKWDGFTTVLKPANEPWILARKPRQLEDEIERARDLVCLSIECAKSAAQRSDSTSSHVSQNPTVDTVHVDAKPLEAKECIAQSEHAISYVPAMSLSTSVAAKQFLNIAMLWLDTLDAICALTSTFTTSTESNPITDLRTFNSCLLASMPEYTPTAEIQLSGLLACVQSADVLLKSALIKSEVGATSARAHVQRTLDPESCGTEYAGKTGLSAENWILTRKPLDKKTKTLVKNVLKWGTGAINTGACSVKSGDAVTINKLESWSGFGQVKSPEYTSTISLKGRWPANLVLSHSFDCRYEGTKTVKGTGPKPSQVGSADDYEGGVYGKHVASKTVSHSDEDGNETVQAWHCSEFCPVRRLDAQSGDRKATLTGRADPNSAHPQPATARSERHIGAGGMVGGTGNVYADEGGASRYFNTFESQVDLCDPFFYAAKSPTREKEAGLENFTSGTVDDGRAKAIDNPCQRGKTQRKNTHATVKNLKLMRHLVKLITPPGGVVLDPFCGSGSTGCAAVLEGFRFIGIDQSPDYCALSRARIAHWEKVT